MVNNWRICTVCRKPNPYGKHYYCATGKKIKLEKLEKSEVKVIKPNASSSNT
jgi:hypothetical protein